MQITKEKTSSAGRLLEYDFVRATAMIFVVAVHTLVVIDFSDAVSLLYFHVMQAIFFSCNGMFFIMSGKFALLTKGPYHKYYLKKFTSIVIPMLFYFFVRTIYQAENISGHILIQYGKNLLGGLSNTEYWFLYVLLGNLLAAPLLGKAFAGFDSRDSVLFIGLGLLFHAVMTIAAICSVNYGFTYLFGGWSFYFYLGVCADNIVRQNNRKWLWIGAGICLAATVALKYCGIVQYVHDLSPVFTIFTLGMYYLLLEAGRKITAPLFRKIIGYLAKHSFSVYLMHMMILEPLRDRIQPQQGMISIVAHVIFTIVVLLISLGFATIVDNFLLVSVCKRISQSAEVLYAKCSRLKK